MVDENVFSLLQLCEPMKMMKLDENDAKPSFNLDALSSLVVKILEFWTRLITIKIYVLCAKRYDFSSV